MTQNEKVLKYMREHGSISSMEAFGTLHITRLSARIFDLRKSGYNIGSVYKRVTDTSGNFMYGYDRYFLKDNSHA